MKKIFFSLLFISSFFALTSCSNSNEQVSNEAHTTQETVTINGVTHFIKTMGEGEPLLVLHGGPGFFHDYLVPHFKTLAKKYQIIFYDQRGCGKTEFPQDTLSINIKTYVEDLEGIRKHLKLEKLNLVGHSWGSMLAMNYAKKYPNNLNRLILISPVPVNTNYFEEAFSNLQQKRSEEDTKELVQIMMSEAFKKREEKVFKETILLWDKANLVDQEKVTELYKPISFSVAAANNLMLAGSLLEKTYHNYNLIDGLDAITCPTLIVLGSLDNVPFASIQEIQENIKGSRLEVIKNTCHYPFFEAPKKFNAVIKNFIAPEYEQ